MSKKFWLLIFLGIALAGCGMGKDSASSGGDSGTGNGKTDAVSFFDDFIYTGPSDSNLSSFHWNVREEGGAPGFSDSQFKPSQISFVDFVDEGASNKFLRLAAETSGTPASCIQAEIYHQQKFLAGTYAARVRFYDNAVEGNDGDVIVSTFFTIRDTNYTDANYSECDFEYLANGGWERDKGNPALYFTSWAQTLGDVENIRQDILDQSLSGQWHTLVLVVDQTDRKVRYFVDGVLRAEHSGDYYPKGKMTIDFNLWFSKGENDLRQSDQSFRRYIQDVDWVFYAKDQNISTQDILTQVAGLRSKTIQRLDKLN